MIADYPLHPPWITRRQAVPNAADVLLHIPIEGNQTRVAAQLDDVPVERVVPLVVADTLLFG